VYKIGDIFHLDEEYSARAEYCNNNNLVIMEIEADNEGRRFQIQAIPEPTAFELVLDEISQKKALLEKYKEDVEQVELFGMERADYEDKKKICANIILELRDLEKQLQ
jgi:hypothetical protein